MSGENNNVVQLTEARLKEIVKEGVCEALLKYGVEADAPIEMQRDFQYLRDLRLLSRAIHKKGLLTFVAVLVTSTSALILLSFIGNPPK